jgi:BREX protein BrxB
VKKKFDELLELMTKPIRDNGGIKTDNSILVVYPPEEELDFRDYLLDTFVPLVRAKGLPLELLDLSGFLFETIDEQTLTDLEQDEFDDYNWVKQGLSKRVESALPRRLAEIAAKSSGGTIFIYGTVALHPLLRFGELLRGLRDIPARIVIAFPGEERGGKLHFMNQPDGGNYLAVKLC